MFMQQALPGFQLGEKELLKNAMALPIETKISLAIKLLKGHEEIAISANENGYWLAFSGGKDSIVIKELARMAGVKFKPVYNQTTIDPPELVRFIQKEHADVEWNRPEKNLIWKMTDKSNGPPTRLARWCCEIYKEHGGTGWVKIIGVRAAESPRRAAQWRQVQANRNGGAIVCPILYWTDADIWQFIKKQNLKYCSLYDEGFKRLGCVGCPMSGPEGIKRDFARWPGFERLWKIGFQRYWARWKGVPRRDGDDRWIERFQSWEEFYTWWTSREAWAPADGCQMSLQFSGGDNEPDTQ